MIKLVERFLWGFLSYSAIHDVPRTAVNPKLGAQFSLVPYSHEYVVNWVTHVRNSGRMFTPGV